MNRGYTYRRHKRYVKGMRRLKEDRMQHDGEKTCPCFDEEADRGRGIFFDGFADTPHRCSNYYCGNPRRHFGELTLQEQRAPRVEDWE